QQLDQGSREGPVAAPEVGPGSSASRDRGVQQLPGFGSLHTGSVRNPEPDSFRVGFAGGRRHSSRSSTAWPIESTARAVGVILASRMWCRLWRTTDSLSRRLLARQGVDRHRLLLVTDAVDAGQLAPQLALVELLLESPAERHRDRAGLL